MLLRAANLLLIIRTLTWPPVQSVGAGNCGCSERQSRILDRFTDTLPVAAVSDKTVRFPSRWCYTSGAFHCRYACINSREKDEK